MSLSYLPNVSPKNNSTAQIRRRVNDIVSEATRQGMEIQTLSTPPTPLPPDPVTLSGAVHASANPGGASALPSTPAGYTTVSINGQQFKIPLYAL